MSNEPTPDPRRDALEQLASRGTARGAGAVLDAARGTRSGRRRDVVVAVAATLLVALAASSVAVFVAGDDDAGDRAERATGALGDTTSTTEPRVVAASAQGLVLFDSCEDALGEIREHAIADVTEYGMPQLGGELLYQRGFLRDEVTAGAGGASGAASGGSPAPTRVRGPSAVPYGVNGPPGESSGTNTQEAGIDEPDIVDTDGRRLFVLTSEDSGPRLAVVALGSDPRRTPGVRLPMAVATGMMRLGDRMIVLGHMHDQASAIAIVDVAADPVVEQSMELEGVIVDARVVDGRVHVVSGHAPSIDYANPAADTTAARRAAAARNREIVASSTIDDWFPDWRVADATGQTVSSGGHLSECTQTSQPKEFAGYSSTTLLTLDLDDLTKSHSATVQADTSLVYASDTSLYVTSAAWDTVERQLVRPDDSTSIHRFVLGDEPTYAGTGTVPGNVGSGWGLSEYDGHLRVATHTWFANGQTRVRVLRIDDDKLTQVGAIDGIGDREQTYAVRWIGPLGYIVTFRQIDPLHVIDVRDPTNPRVAGELEIPGYSTYLHPVGDGLLLGVGQDADAQGRTTGAQLSLFDVRDPARPKRLDAFKPSASPFSSSPIDTDYHAFLWWEDDGRAFIPIVTVDPTRGGGSAIVVVTVEGNRLAEVGRLTPRADAPPPLRTVIAGDQVTGVFESGVRVAALDTLEPQAWVDL